MARLTTYIRAGDTEQLQLVISGYRMVSNVKTALADLTELHEAVLYLRKRGEATNEVDGVVLTLGAEVLSLIFDPVANGPSGANAFADPAGGTFDGYILCTWSDGDTTRHPGQDDGGGYPELHVVVAPNFE